MPTSACGSVCHAVGANAQLAGAGTRIANGPRAAGRARRPSGAEAHLHGPTWITSDRKLCPARERRRHTKLSCCRGSSFGLVAGRLWQRVAVAAATPGGGPDAALDRCRTFSRIPAHAASLGRTRLKLAILGTMAMTRSKLKAT